MPKDSGNNKDYEIFYAELPQTDYLGDIEIQDEYDDNNYDNGHGLSDQQVSEIAKDSLAAAGQDTPTPDTDQSPEHN